MARHYAHQETVSMRMPQKPSSQIFEEMQAAAKLAQQAAAILSQAISISLELVALSDAEKEIDAITSDWLVAISDDLSLPDELPSSDAHDDIVEHSSTIVPAPCDAPCFSFKTSHSEALSL
jgi:hypothetical protein